MFEYVKDSKNIEKLIKVARGIVPADLLIKNGSIVNVFSHEIYIADVAICDGFIAGVGSGYSGETEIDATGKYICPGFMDGHLHVESSMVPVPEFARAVVPHGTTTIIIDPHEIANVMGTTGISYMLKTSKYNPLNVFMMLPSCVPATPFETAGADLKALDLLPILQDKWVLGLGEVMNYYGVINGSSDVLDKIKIANGKIIDGHAPGLSGQDLNAYVVAGMQSDHECTTPEEALEKLRLGMWIMIREGSTTKNLKDLVPLVNTNTSSQCIFVTDDRSPAELLDEGHIDNMIREAIQAGVDPITAIQMATINTARYFGLKGLGGIAPGYFADVIVLDDLEEVRVNQVFKGGICVAQDGQSVYQTVDHPEILLRGSMNVKWIEPQHIQIKAKSNTINVIELIPGQIITRVRTVDNPKTKDGMLISDPERDILKMVVIERHYGSGSTGIGMIRGFGLKQGAVASTISHDSHNIIAIGVSDEDIFTAVVQLVKQQGGIAIANHGTVEGYLPLPIGGLMSDKPLLEVRNSLEKLVNIVRGWGCDLEHPFMTLSFMALPVIPELKLTDKGLYSTEKNAFIDLFTTSN